MREYELMFVLDPNLDEEAVAATTERVRSYITARGGEVASIEPWGGGRRRLAYPIRHFREGIYSLARFKLPPDATDDLDRSLKLTESIIRHLIVHVEAK